MDDTEARNAIDADLGISLKATSVVPRTNFSHGELARVSADIRSDVSHLLNQSAPETLGQKVLDAFLPSPVRAAKRRGDTALVQVAVDTRVAVFAAMAGAQVKQMEALAESYAVTAELQTKELIAMKGIDVAGAVDDEIERSGAIFDKKIDESVKQAGALTSNSARASASDRIRRRMELRGRIEDAAMNGVCDAVSGVRKRP